MAWYRQSKMSTERLVKGLRAARRGIRLEARSLRRFRFPSRRARVRRRCVLDPLGARGEVSGAPHRGRRRSRRVRDCSFARRNHLLARSRRLGPAADAGLFRFRQCRERRTRVSAPKRIKEADGGEVFGYDSGVVFPLRVKPATPRSPRRSSSTPISLCARKSACRPRRISNSSFRPLRARRMRAR